MRSSVNMEQDMQALERDLCWIMVELANSDQRERDTATQWRSEEGAGRSHGALKVSRNFVYCTRRPHSSNLSFLVTLFDPMQFMAPTLAPHTYRLQVMNKSLS